MEILVRHWDVLGESMIQAVLQREMYGLRGLGCSGPRLRNRLGPWRVKYRMFRCRWLNLLKRNRFGADLVVQSRTAEPYLSALHMRGPIG